MISICREHAKNAKRWRDAPDGAALVRRRHDRSRQHDRAAKRFRRVNGHLHLPALRAALERDFYPPLREFVTSGPLVVLVLEGDEAIDVVRALLGATDGRKAAAGTIRGDLSLSNCENLVHGSDLPDSADREIKLWFPDLA
jgi:nucleoside-diphosphate kinase